VETVAVETQERDAAEALDIEIGQKINLGQFEAVSIFLNFFGSFGWHFLFAWPLEEFYLRVFPHQYSHISFCHLRHTFETMKFLQCVY
jgi:hypothetical protein